MNQRKDPYFQPYTLRARRQGKTTEAIKTAPPGAFYVVPNHTFIAYAEKLARHLGRGDLRFVSAADLCNLNEKMRGIDKLAVVDHAAEPLSVEQTLAIRLHNARVSAKENKS